MDFLIILFIIISVISSIVKNIKKQTKSKPGYDPWSFDSESVDAEKLLKEKIPTEKEEVFNYEEAKPEIEISLAEKQKNKQETELKGRVEQVDKSIEIDHPEETKDIAKTPFQGLPKEDLKVKKSGELEKELKKLLVGDNLPLGIISLEVLGPPRALRPYKFKRI